MHMKFIIAMLAAVRSHIILTGRKWILAERMEENRNYYCEPHYEQHLHRSTYLMGQICFDFFNDRIKTDVRVLEEKGKQVIKNIATYHKIVIVLSSTDSEKFIGIQSLAKILRTPLFKNRCLSLFCGTVLLWLSKCVESLVVMAFDGCACDCDLSSW